MRVAAAGPGCAIRRQLAAEQRRATTSGMRMARGYAQVAGVGRAGPGGGRQFASLCSARPALSRHSPTRMAASGVAVPPESTRLVVASGQVAGMAASSQSGDVELTAPSMEGVTGVIHDEAASQFAIRDSSSGKPAAFVEYSVTAGICEPRPPPFVLASLVLQPAKRFTPGLPSPTPLDPPLAQLRGWPSETAGSFAGSGCKGGTIDLFHTFSDPAFRGKVREHACSPCPDCNVLRAPIQATQQRP